MCAQFALLHIEVVQYFNIERSAVWYMNNGSSFTALKTVAKIIVENNFHTSVVYDGIKWFDQFFT
jgi:hypothetical protein